MNGQPVAGALPTSLSEEASDRVAALFDTHHARLFRLARRLTSSADDALDLVQETFLRVARSAATRPGGHEHEEAWLVRVLVNTRRDQWRQAATRRRHDLEGGEPPLAVDSHEAASMARATVWRALDVLPPRRRAVVVMHELEGLSAPAIARLLGIHAVTVRWHLSMGRRDLARQLGDQGRRDR